ncbi:hypothetical protein B0O99DRAFT_604529 [Bisporella sp. PMI_857]|nr:hypothetical protein B0O99DRAFT_604529 [Bisporella sp. PMI_857]
MSDTEVVPTAPPKRSLFRKKIYHQPVEEVKDGVEFFSRAKELFPIRLAEEEERRQKKAAKLERKRSSMDADRKSSSTPEPKKRRVSSQAPEEVEAVSSGEDDYKPISRSNQAPHTNPPLRSADAKIIGSPTSLSERYTRDLSRKGQDSHVTPRRKGEIEATQPLAVTNKTAIQPISIDTDEEDVDLYTLEKPTQISDDEPQIQEVEEFPELVARARERERLRVLQAERATAPFTERGYSSNNLGKSVEDDVFQETEISQADPRVEILITSYIENTSPLVIVRTLSQPLKVVRKAWCDKFIKAGVIPASMSHSVFLTWKNKHLYDVTTCASLCKRSGDDGRPSADDLDQNGRLHLEAWSSNEMFNAHLRKLAEPTPEPQEEAPVQKYKIAMKGAKDKVPLKMKCARSTTIQKMIDMYRKEHDLPEEKDISLHFEGEELDPSVTIADTELGEEDEYDEVLQVEVHVK